MSANFEIHLTGYQYLPPEKFIQIFQVLGEHQSFTDITAYPDWHIAEEQGETIQAAEIKRRLQNGSVVLINGTVKDTRIGILEYIEHGRFSYDLWIHTARYPSLDSDFVGPENALFYNGFSSALAGIVHDSVLFAALGAELSLEVDEDLETMILSNRTVSMWLFPPSTSIRPLPGYARQTDSLGTVILKRTG